MHAAKEMSVVVHVQIVARRADIRPPVDGREVVTTHG